MVNWNCISFQHCNALSSLSWPVGYLFTPLQGLCQMSPSKHNPSKLELTATPHCTCPYYNSHRKQPSVILCCFHTCPGVLEPATSVPIHSYSCLNLPVGLVWCKNMYASSQNPINSHQWHGDSCRGMHGGCPCLEHPQKCIWISHLPLVLLFWVYQLSRQGVENLQ